MQGKIIGFGPVTTTAPRRTARPPLVHCFLGQGVRVGECLIDLEGLAGGSCWITAATITPSTAVVRPVAILTPVAPAPAPGTRFSGTEPVAGTAIFPWIPPVGGDAIIYVDSGKT